MEIPKSMIPDNPYLNHDSNTLGDLAGRNHHEEVLPILNGAVARFAQDALTRDPSHLKKVEKQLLTGIADFYISTQTPEGKLNREMIAEGIRLADKLFEIHGKDKSTEERFAFRVAVFRGRLNGFSDFDLTWTEHDRYNVESVPGSAHIEPLLAQHGREAFPFLYGLWASVLKAAPHTFYEAGKHVHDFRPGIEKFLAFMHGRGRRLQIVSASFKPFVEGAVRNFDISPDDVIANTHDNITPTQKGLVLANKAQQDPSSLPFIIGDGPTDFRFFSLDQTQGTNMKDVNPRALIGMAFSLAGQGLSQKLREQGIPFIEYRDFNDITDALEHITERAREIIATVPQLKVIPIAPFANRR